jgi:integrase/recombinase XerD
LLLGTGARISEALSLKRSSINFQTGEATIIGKGNKERVLFFSPRALNWVKEYVSRRKDHGEALFVVAGTVDLCGSVQRSLGSGAFEK